MSLIDRYIIKQVLVATGLVVLVLVGVQSFVEFINELGDIGTGHYTVWVAMQVVPMMMPSELYQLFPMAGLLGSLIGLGRLASSSELVVMRAAGISIAGIVKSVLKAALIMIVIMTVLGEWAAPKLVVAAHQLKSRAVNATVVDKIVKPRHEWFRYGQDFVSVGEVRDANTIKDVRQYQFGRDHRLNGVISASRANRVKGLWELESPDFIRVMPTSIRSERLKEASLSLAISPTFISLSRLQPDQVSVWDLLRNIHYRQESGLFTARYEFALWSRLIQPLATLVMIALGVPFILGSLRSVTMGQRVMVGILVGFAFYMLNQFFGPISLVYQLPPFFAAGIPTLMVGGVIWWMLRRVL